MNFSPLVYFMDYPICVNITCKIEVMSMDSFEERCEVVIGLVYLGLLSSNHSP